MPVSSHLLRKLQETLGADAADDLATWMEGMDANRGDIAELRHETQLGFARMDARFQQVDARFEQVFAVMDARFEKVLAMMDARFQQVDARFQQVDARFEQVFATMDARFKDVDGKILLVHTQGSERLEKALRDQTRFFFLAWAVQLAAIVGLYTR